MTGGPSALLHPGGVHSEEGASACRCVHCVLIPGPVGTSIFQVTPKPGRRKPPHNPAVRDLIRAKRGSSKPLEAEAINAGFLGWHENGYLPHRDEPNLVQFVTYRLEDAFPQELRQEWEFLLKIENDRRRRIEMEAYLDRGRGNCYLRRPEVAKIVEDSLLCFHDNRYDLRAWIIMPNHVHFLIQVWQVPLSKLVDSCKTFTSREANKVIGRHGGLWQKGYWDTYVRNGEHELRARRYIENNPVKAGLVSFAKDWPWSSARYRDGYGRLCFPEDRIDPVRALPRAR